MGIVFNTSFVETDPGCDPDCPFSPPAGWEGDSKAYYDLVRARFDNDRGQAQRIYSYANHYRKVGGTQFTGTYAREAELVVRQISSRTMIKPPPQKETVSA